MSKLSTHDQKSRIPTIGPNS